jgi:hypothetical protein
MVRVSQASQSVNALGEQIVEISNTLVGVDIVSSTSVLLVDGSAVTQPVSGDVGVTGTVLVDGSAVTQPVSGDVGVTGTVLVDGSAVTQPVSISGIVATSTTTPSVTGTNNNHLSGQSVDNTYRSTGFDVSSASRFSIMGNTTDQTSSILLDFSPDGTNWYRANTELYPAWTDTDTPFDFYTSFDGACVKYVRLNFANYTTTETVNCTILTQ